MDMSPCFPTPAPPCETYGPSQARLMRIGDRLELPASAMEVDRNEEIYGEGDPSDYVYQVTKGAVRTARYLEDGRRQIGAFFLPGDIFGYESGTSHRFSAEAVSETEVLMVRQAALDRAARRDADAARLLWTLASAQVEHLQDQLLVLGRMTASERVAAFLLDMAKRSPFGAAVDLPMSRADIADYLGLTIETVSRIFTQLRRAQAISLHGSRRIVLRNKMALAGLDA